MDGMPRLKWTVLSFPSLISLMGTSEFNPEVRHPSNGSDTGGTACPAASSGGMANAYTYLIRASPGRSDCMEDRWISSLREVRT
jgi:hypothetical protein